MHPNNVKHQNTLTVVTTATIQINLDGTWNIIAFEADDNKQTKFSKYVKPKPLDWDYHSIRGAILNKKMDKERQQAFNQKSDRITARKKRAKETKTRKPRIRSHCKKCGMKGKNILTCLSTVDRKGNARSQHHRI